MTYFYVYAALPALQLGKGLPLGKGALLSFIGDHLPQLSSTLLFVENAFPYVEFPDIDCDFLNRWVAYNRSFRSALVFHRKIPFKFQEETVSRNLRDGFAMHSAEAVTQIPNAMDKESEILLSMERGLTELEQGYAYTIENLIAYAIRVVLVERFEMYSKVAGWKQFNAVQTGLFEAKKELFAEKVTMEALL